VEWTLEQNKKIKECRRREVAYKEVLEKLADLPSDTKLRQEAIRLGREYADYSRKCAKQVGVTVFDEVALMNDLNAVCGGAEPSTEQERDQHENIESRLEKLESLKNKGLISQEEYSSKRSKILEEI